MRALTLYNTHIRRVVAVVAGIIALSVFLYGALLLGAVAHAAGRTTAEQKLRALSSEVSKLESHYLSQTKGLSPERAANLGFVPPIAVATVFAGEPSLVVR
jgi:hypothetical protein